MEVVEFVLRGNYLPPEPNLLLNTMNSLRKSLALLPLVLASFAAAQEDPIAELKKQLADPTKPFTTIVEFTVKEEGKKEFMKLAREAVKNTRKEEGNFAYQVHSDVKDAKKLVFFEVWANVESLEKHIKQEYTAKLLGSVETLCEGKPDIRLLTPMASPYRSKAEAAAGAPTAPAAPASK
jgi:quinol monooxygenase YgiN